MVQRARDCRLLSPQWNQLKIPEEEGTESMDEVVSYCTDSSCCRHSRASIYTSQHLN